MSAQARRFGVVGILITISLISTPARAAFNFTAQSRSISAHTHGSGGDVSQSFTAPDFALFDKTASAPHPTGGSSDQHQRSELLSNAITIVGGWSGFPPSFAGTGQADGNSSTSVTFTVPSTTDADLTAQASFLDGNPGVVGSISLTGPSTSVAWYLSHSAGPPGAPWPVNGNSTHLTLGPGSYTLNANFSSNRVGTLAFNQNYVSSFDVELTQSVPEPASFGATITLVLMSLRLRRSR